MGCAVCPESDWYHGWSSRYQARNDEMVRLAAAGFSCQQIALHFDLSRERVNAILRPKRPVQRQSPHHRSWAGFPRQVRPIFDWEPEYVFAVLERVGSVET